jgi:predicted transcriptional regulator
MIVEEVMRTNPLMIDPLSSLREALAMMKEKKVKSLVVNKQNPHDAYGIITYTSVLKAIVAEDGDIDLLNVYDVYMKPAITISKYVDIKHAAKLMVDHGIKRIVVADANEIEGLITMTDIIENLMDIHQL